MTYSPAVAPTGTPAAHQAPQANAATESVKRSAKLFRKYEILHLLPNGDIGETAKVGPAIQVFEDAFSAFARGTLLRTDRGPVAIEDLLPGDKVETIDNGFQTLLWKGSCMLVPGIEGQSKEMGHLTRVSADAMGWSKPSRDAVFGPAARIAHRTPAMRQLTGQDIGFVPLRDFIDGINIVEVTPITAVQVFHVAFAEQERVLADGIEVETYHPGAVHRLPLRGDALTLFLSMFPMISDITDFSQPNYTRLRLSDIEMFSAA